MKASKPSPYFFMSGECGCPRSRTQKNTASVFVYLLIFSLCVFIYKFINKDSLIEVIFKNLPPREASLMAGMVFGTNIVLVFRGLVERIASWIGRRRAILLGFGVTLVYINWVGWEIPAVRAFLLMSIFYWAQILGRKFNLFRAIMLIILIMVLADYRVF